MGSPNFMSLGICIMPGGSLSFGGRPACTSTRGGGGGGGGGRGCSWACSSSLSRRTSHALCSGGTVNWVMSGRELERLCFGGEMLLDSLSVSGDRALLCTLTGDLSCSSFLLLASAIAPTPTPAKFMGTVVSVPSGSMRSIFSPERMLCRFCIMAESGITTGDFPPAIAAAAAADVICCCCCGDAICMAAAAAAAW